MFCGDLNIESDELDDDFFESAIALLTAEVEKAVLGREDE